MKWIDSGAIVPAAIAFFGGMAWAYYTVYGTPFWGNVDWLAVSAIASIFVVISIYYSMVEVPKRLRKHRFNALMLELMNYEIVLQEAGFKFVDFNEPSAPPEFSNLAYQLALQDIGYLGKDMARFSLRYEEVRRYDNNWQRLIEHRKKFPNVLEEADEQYFQSEYENLKKTNKYIRDSVMECVAILHGARLRAI